MAHQPGLAKRMHQMCVRGSMAFVEASSSSVLRGCTLLNPMAGDVPMDTHIEVFLRVEYLAVSDMTCPGAAHNDQRRPFTSGGHRHGLAMPPAAARIAMFRQNVEIWDVPCLLDRGRPTSGQDVLRRLSMLIRLTGHATAYVVRCGKASAVGPSSVHRSNWSSNGITVDVGRDGGNGENGVSNRLTMIRISRFSAREPHGRIFRKPGPRSATEGRQREAATGRLPNIVFETVLAFIW
ncbi:hypothetical protein B0T13DRAFT_447234 [Neurospora crassa]|nr:hypothetical protein B0T13DRAFT_447234 [Neurospora crassa]